jgi:hypothetical protein
MEEVEDAAAGVVRKRKRDASVAGVVVLPGGEAAGIEGDGSFSWKELAEKEEEGEECEGIAEASVEEVMRWLETEISSPGKDDGADGFVTINGNEESCGPSFSAAASTVMASVDTRLGAPPPPTPIPWPWPEPEPDSSTNDDDGSKAMTSAANELLDEQWLLDLLAAGGPFSLELE